ncbi:MAG: radical SAM protein [Solobacterium sp.]|nr:radical SAM protein [Solobacterium sp.]
MHYTGTLYRNPYEPPSPLLEITQGCTHNKCKFCTMYKNVPFRMSPIEWIREDLAEIAQYDPHTQRLQLIGADPFCMSFERLNAICDLVHQYLPDVRIMTMAARVDNVRNKTVEQLKILKEKGMSEVNLGVESGDDWTLERFQKGYHASDILEQCHKLDEAGISYWMTFLNGVAGKEHSHEHAIHSAEIFSQCHPMVVGTGGLTLFPDTPLLDEARRGEFDPLSEREMLEELRTFVQHLTVDCYFITHHTVAANLTGPHFLARKQQILDALDRVLNEGDMDRLAWIRSRKTNL